MAAERSCFGEEVAPSLEMDDQAPELSAELTAAVNAIRADNLRGAVALSREAALVVKRAVSGPARPTWPLVVHLCKSLVDAQPMMAPMFNLANSVLLAAEPRKDSEGFQRAVAEACDEFDTRTRVSLERIARLANSLLPDGTTILTHSASQTVLATLEEARRNGKSLAVYCTESRPQREGLEMARKLAAMGCRVKFIVDAAAYRVMDQVSLVLVGADAISREGATNKVGTALVALAAAEKGKPMYALCGSEKWLPAACPVPRELPKPGDEVMEQEAAGVEPVNYYFSVCPLDRLTGIVSDEGILRPEEVAEWLDKLPVHPALLDGGAGVG